VLVGVAYDIADRQRWPWFAYVAALLISLVAVFGALSAAG
jgi:hypothetical protein